jgi:K+-sensing histidine kinase KdpD
LIPGRDPSRAHSAEAVGSSFGHPHLDAHHDGVLQAESFSARVSTLHEIALQIDAARGRDEILRVLHNETKWVIAHDVCFLCLLDKFRTHFSVYTLSPLADATDLYGLSCGVTEGVPGIVISQQTPVYTDLSYPSNGNHPSPADRITDILVDLGMQSLLVVPLRTGDETIGTFAVSSSRPFAYREQEMVIAQLLATQTAVALQHTAMLEDAAKRLTQIELVNELAEKLTSTLELDTLLRSATLAIRATFKFYDVSIFLVNRAESEVVLVAHSGMHDDFLPPGYRQKLADGIVGWAVTHAERVLVQDVTADGRFMAHTYRETRSELAIPIKIDADIVGVLNVEDVRPHMFDETDVTVLETLCVQLGGAINNAKLYDQVKKTNAKLTELDKMKSDFLGIVSHDFRSPLASIVLAGKSLLKRPGTVEPRRLQEYLTVIVEQATRLIQLAEDTLSITKMESGQLNYFFNVVNVERLIKDAAAMVNMTRRHTLQYEVDKNITYVRGDQTKLRQVVQNLLTNAVKYSPRGGLVQVKAANYSRDQLIVTVRDEGMGIPTEQMNRLFQKFSRVDTPQAREIKGSGLGLWICREIVKAHGGQIWVESEEGQGSSFSFTLRKVQPETPRPDSEE